MTGDHVAGILQWETVVSLLCPPLPASWSLVQLEATQRPWQWASYVQGGVYLEQRAQA